MSFPIMYDEKGSGILTNGLGVLSDCISCRSVHEPPGLWDLRIVYPVGGHRYEAIRPNRMVTAKIPYMRNPQIFRIYSMVTTLDGLTTIKAHHISYDLAGIIVNPFSAASPAEAVKGIKDNALTAMPFNLRSTLQSSKPYSIKTPRPARDCLFGREGSLVDVYGGQLQIDNTSVVQVAAAGADNGFAVRYGKNMTAMRQEVDLSNFYTGVVPMWEDLETGAVTMLPNRIVAAPGDHPIDRVKVLDCSMDFETQPTAADLEDRARRYIETNSVGKPQMLLSASFEQEGTNLGPYDTATIHFPGMAPTPAKVRRLETNVLLDSVDRFELGTVRRSIADSVAYQQIELDRLLRR